MENVALPHTAPRNSMAPSGLSCPGTRHAGMGGLWGTKAVCARPLGSQGLLLACLCPGWWLRETRGVCNMRCTAGKSRTTTGVAKEALRTKAATKKNAVFTACQWMGSCAKLSVKLGKHLGSTNQTRGDSCPPASTNPLWPQLNHPQKGVMVHSSRSWADSCWPWLHWRGWPPGQV